MPCWSRATWTRRCGTAWRPAARPDSALAYCALGELAGHGRYTFTDADVQHMQDLLAAGRQSTHDASMLHFTLAAYWEKKGDHDEAFRCYRQANELKREVYRQSNQAFDRRKHLDLIDNLIAVFTPEFSSRPRQFGSTAKCRSSWSAWSAPAPAWSSRSWPAIPRSTAPAN